jgi:PadR family transcriptional regulator PadR
MYYKTIEMGMKKLPGLEAAVLAAVLRMQDNAYGVSIMDEVSKREGRGIAYGAIHTTLKRLLDKGFLKAKMGEPTAEQGGRRKRFYRITRKGEGALQMALLVNEQHFSDLRLPKPAAS